LLPDLGGVKSGSPETLPALASTPSSLQIDPALKSIVADIRAEEVVVDNLIHETLLREMIDEGVRRATASSSAAEGWNRLLKSDDVIGIKFNRIGQETIGTTLVFAPQLVESLKTAGFSPGQMVLIEAPQRLAQALKTKPCPFGFIGGKISFGSGEDEIAAVLQEVTAIVNVPFLKTHNIAGMSCCLKNLSHAFIRRPKLCHAQGCSPFVGDILSLPQIRTRLRIHVVDALRAVFDGGPLPARETLWAHGGILVSTDPVAADSVATDILNDQRGLRRLPPIGGRDGRVRHVRAAAARGLGTDDQDYITVQRPSLF